MLFTILLVVQVLVSISLIGLILVQQGKGADAGAAFGSGASGTVFGAQGAANFLSRATAVLATAFFVISLGLAYLIGGSNVEDSQSVTEQLQIEEPGAQLLDTEKKKQEQGQTSQKKASGDDTTEASHKTESNQVPSPERLPK